MLLRDTWASKIKVRRVLRSLRVRGRFIHMPPRVFHVAQRTKPLIEIAEDFLALARQEAEEGYRRKDERRVRDAAEKAWNAVVQATDHAMRSRGRIPEPGPDAHVARHEFLEAIGRRDLSKELSYFADRLHGECFYKGACPTRDGMRVALDEAEDFIRKVKRGV